jgi:hypothetical protein
MLALDGFVLDFLGTIWTLLCHEMPFFEAREPKLSSGPAISSPRIGGRLLLFS